VFMFPAPKPLLLCIFLHLLNTSFTALIMFSTFSKCGACSSVVVKALCYKLESRVFDTQWGVFFFKFT
jgi:hypothetical protein